MTESASCEVMVVIVILCLQIGRSLSSSRYERILDERSGPIQRKNRFVRQGAILEARVRHSLRCVDWRIASRTFVLVCLGVLYCIPMLSFFALFDWIKVGTTVAKWYAASGVSLLFGIVVQLLWEDKPLTEPL